MNILIYRYNSICEDAVIRGLKELGHTVYEVILEVENKSPSGQEILDAVVMGMEKSNADIIFSINYYPALSEIARVYKLLYYSWIVDAPVLELYSKTIKNRCNRVFIFDSELYREISVYNPYNIFYLPLAADCDFYQNAIRNASLSDVEKYTHNITFVGSLYTEKCPYDKVKNLSPKISGYLHGIMKAQEKIYGYYFVEELLSDELVDEFVKNYDGYYLAGEEDLLTKKRTLAQFYIGNKITAMERVDTFKYLSEKFEVDIYTASDTKEIPKLKNHGTIMTHTKMPIVFNKSTINLNPTSKPIRSGIPLRIFDLLACEGFVLCNYQSDLLNEFLPGEELDIYSSIEELEEKIRYYLSHTDVCREIAHNGYEKVSKRHTYPLRLEQMFRLGEHRRR
ncbi:CgeB family protein [Butyribacter intestini]|jgi:spore maturation protein CgeB|uniref:CgeB family protein n=1 Tax=Butyribacter intestini TaxID=1703332 RepID=UPI0022E7178E|nr:glycosyltransferase [Butyribacter intestini]